VKKKPTKYVLKRWEIDEFNARMAALEQKMKYLSGRSIEAEVVIYSADQDVAISMNDPKWHRVVCKYEGDRCIGSPRIHWTSRWDIKSDGFHLKSFELDDYTSTPRYKGWRGQYNPENQYKYDELPRDIVSLHHTTLVNHIAKLGIWYPCHLYNDFTGELYRP